MTKPPISLAQTLDQTWQILQEHLLRSAAPRRFVTLATCDPSGAPQLRTVALRSSDRSAAEIEVYTDASSRKIKEIEENPKASCLVWAPDSLVQLRLSGRIRIETGAPLLETWNALPEQAKLNYSHHPTPGIAIPRSDAYSQIPAPDRFARLRLHLAHIDHVCLDPAGHRRAEFEIADDWAGQWLSP